MPITYLYFPETKGLELEDVDRLFAKEGSDVAASIDIETARRLSAAPTAEDQEKVAEVSRFEETPRQKV